jgi:hypothetical protein
MVWGVGLSGRNPAGFCPVIRLGTGLHTGAPPRPSSLRSLLRDDVRNRGRAEREWVQYARAVSRGTCEQRKRKGPLTRGFD